MIRLELPTQRQAGRMKSSSRQFFVDWQQSGLLFYADARCIRNSGLSLLNRNSIRKTSKRLKDPGIRFIATQSETRRNVQGHLVATVGNATPR